MSSIIQPNYVTRAYSAPTKARETKQTGTQANGFLDMAAQASRGQSLLWFHRWQIYCFLYFFGTLKATCVVVCFVHSGLTIFIYDVEELRWNLNFQRGK